VTLQSISFGLAILLGIIAFALVKHTADEFDKWYETDTDNREQRLRIPAAAVGALIVVVGAAFLFFR
jgi:ABC-type nickel/cobalt efflux system permease component RcnA